MSDHSASVGSSAESYAKIVYILYLVGLVVPITGIVGVVMAYIHKSDAPEWLQTHFQLQIRTFWIGALYMFIGVLLAILVIGYLVLLFWIVWLIVRSVKGLTALSKGEAYPNPTGWFF